MRNCILQYGIVSMYLLVHAAREDDIVDDLLKAKLLTEEEAHIIRLANLFQRAMIPWSWILRVCYESWMLQGLPPPNFERLQDQVIKSRDAMQVIHTILDTQIPFAYAHAIIGIVGIANMIIIIRAAAKMSQLFTGEEQLWRTDPDVLLQVLIPEIIYVVFVPALYTGCLQICEAIDNPLLNTYLSFPAEFYYEYIKHVGVASEA